MKLQEREQQVVATPVAVRPLEVVGTPKPNVEVRARIAPRRKGKANSFAALGRRALIFGSIVGAVYVTSTLMGYVALERARQGARHGAQRAAYARSEAKAAREGIETLTNPTTLRTWAEAHGFVAGDTTPDKAGTVVARR